MKRVYFIRPVGWQGPIKIGCSVSPTGRRKSLEAWSPVALEIIAEIDGGHDIERRFHQRFLESHRAHEWFDWTAELEETISEIRAGVFDISTLPQTNGSPLERGKSRAPWTPEQRQRQSLTLRIGRMKDRTGFAYNGRYGDIGASNLYLTAPHVYGRPIDATWARKLQREWMRQHDQLADC